MPELPEVENMRLELLPLCGKMIKHVTTSGLQLRKVYNSSFLEDISQKCLVNVTRQGKYLLLHLSGGGILLMHAGMSGRILVVKQDEPKKKHDHINLKLESGEQIVFNDARRFGLALTFKNLTEAKNYISIGLDALSGELTPAAIYSLLKTLKSPIKAVLLNQKIIAGLGNIYVCEVLFKAGVHPESLASCIPKPKLNLICKYIKETLERAIELGGSTLKDYKKPNGESGSFQNEFVAYNKSGTICTVCGDTIVKTVQAGRSTFYCLKHQTLYCKAP